MVRLNWEVGRAVGSMVGLVVSVGETTVAPAGGLVRAGDPTPAQAAKMAIHNRPINAFAMERMVALLFSVDSTWPWPLMATTTAIAKHQTYSTRWLRLTTSVVTSSDALRTIKVTPCTPQNQFD